MNYKIQKLHTKQPLSDTRQLDFFFLLAERIFFFLFKNYLIRAKIAIVLKKIKIELDDFKNYGRKLRGYIWELSDILTEFDLYIDIMFLS